MAGNCQRSALALYLGLAGGRVAGVRWARAGGRRRARTAGGETSARRGERPWARTGWERPRLLPYAAPGLAAHADWLRGLAQAKYGVGAGQETARARRWRREMRCACRLRWADARMPDGGLGTRAEAAAETPRNAGGWGRAPISHQCISAE
ncbi:hypothetical protein B0H15DRAFT_815163 [Mycena belliarum]|uniref:Uncharacterized protein n=1 Tax=Mycena belliarum TaxID=1033014 RepID=A0AAD6UGI7_9AGAR|nr:hypothetical protein B0H15DRAFT_815163 [Mycena belliae]